jgi:hypothetical protein
LTSDLGFWSVLGDVHALCFVSGFDVVRSTKMWIKKENKDYLTLGFSWTFSSSGSDSDESFSRSSLSSDS